LASGFSSNKWLENVVSGIHWNTEAIVLNRPCDAFMLPLNGNANISMGWRIFYGIVDEISQDEFESNGIECDPMWRAVITREALFFFIGEMLDRFENFVCECGDIGALVGERREGQSIESEEIVDQLLESFGFFEERFLVRLRSRIHRLPAQVSEEVELRCDRGFEFVGNGCKQGAALFVPTLSLV
jgi:hypothetical protein